jgi:hypothetical protein
VSIASLCFVVHNGEKQKSLLAEAANIRQKSELTLKPYRQFLCAEKTSKEPGKVEKIDSTRCTGDSRIELQN